MSKPTNADLRAEIRDLLDVPAFEAGNAQLRSRTLAQAVEAVGGEPWGGSPSLRAQLRAELDLTEDGEQDPSGLRNADLLALRDALEDGGRDE